MVCVCVSFQRLTLKGITTQKSHFHQRKSGSEETLTDGQKRPLKDGAAPPRHPQRVEMTSPREQHSYEAT